MNRPLVSIAIITYNHEKFVGNTLETVLMQKTTFPIEIIIGEDSSTDNTRKICNGYLNKYNDIIDLLLNRKKLGMFDNYTRTINACKGKYIAICEGDDYWTDPYKLQKQFDILEKNSKVVAVVTNASKCDNNSKIIDDKGFDITCKEQTNVISLDDFFMNTNSYPTPTVMFRNDTDRLLEQLNYLTNKYLADWILWILLHLKGDFYYLNESTACYRVNPNSVTHTVNEINRWKYDFIIRRKLREILPSEYHKYLNENGYAYLRIAKAYRKQNKYLLFALNFLQSFLSNPIKLIKNIYYTNIRKR